MLKSAILQLYKQHHIKKYGELTEGQYSCWGNYDSMSIQVVTLQKDTLIISRDALGLTDMWYQLSDMLGKQDGSYSQQCIGLIYNEQDDGTLESFLVPNEYFCCACLIKLRDSYQTDVYNKLTNMIKASNKTYEPSISTSESSDDIKAYVHSICFRTMDNADAVVLIKGNSYQKIMDHVVTIIGNIEEILYTYSICGINQKYLKNEEWNPGHNLINDKIHQITSRIIANPTIDPSTLEKVFGGSGEWAQVFGNTDIVWHVNDEGLTINRAINLMRPYTDKKLTGHAVASHSHPLYGNSIYGITTEIVARHNAYNTQTTTVYSLSTPQDTTQEAQWCRNRIKFLQKRLDKNRKLKNDLLYSYYLALIQSLNTIVPYEESLFSKDLFYIVFPSLLMFHKQLDATLEKQDEIAECQNAIHQKWEALIKNLTGYLDMLDQIIYRSIHSEQTFFMVPGYCGVLYTILPKLNMMYMALLYSGIEILQGESEVYECCLYPVIDSKPSTTEIDFHLEPAERLIEIKVSQRSMFTANLMPILLLHELAHYVGTSRNRLPRALYMIHTWGALLTKMLLWNTNASNDIFQKKCLELIYEENQEDIYKYITTELIDLISKENQKRQQGERKELYFNDMFFMLVRFSNHILQDPDGMLRAKLQKKGNKLKTKICENCSQKEFLMHMHKLEDVYTALDKKTVSLLEDNETIQKLEKSMKICFKETYADIVSLYLIGFQDFPELFERYLEVFYLSEGVSFHTDSLSNEEINRVAVTAAILSSLDPCAAQCWNTLVQNKQQKYEMNKSEMNSIDYLVLYAYIYQMKMLKEENAVKGPLLEIAQTMPSETEYSIAEMKTTWDNQIHYFNHVAKNLSESNPETRQITSPRNEKHIAQERIRKLYSLLNNSGKDTRMNLQAFDEIIRWYIHIMNEKRTVYDPENVSS